VPANWHITVVCPLNTRTQNGHIRGTRDAARPFATPADTLSQVRSRAHHRGSSCLEAINRCLNRRGRDPLSPERGSAGRAAGRWKGPGTATPAGRCRRRVLSRRARGDGGTVPVHRLGALEEMDLHVPAGRASCRAPVNAESLSSGRGSRLECKPAPVPSNEEPCVSRVAGRGARRRSRQPSARGSSPPGRSCGSGSRQGRALG
jgi:hypothetical protein